MMSLSHYCDVIAIIIQLSDTSIQFLIIKNAKGITVFIN